MIKIILTIGMSIKIVREISELARRIVFFGECMNLRKEDQECDEQMLSMVKRNKRAMLVESILSCLLLLAVFAWMSFANI